MPGKVHADVYRAIKLRKLGARNRITEIRTMRQRDAIDYATSVGLGHWEDANGWIPRRKIIKNSHMSVLPPIFRERVVCQVTHVVHPNKFFLRPEDNRNKEIFIEIHTKLNSRRLHPFPADANFNIGQMVAAPVQENSDNYARAVLKSYRNVRATGNVSWTVFFIDYGHTATMEETFFRQLDDSPDLEYLKDIPPRAFEATLTEIQPSAIISPQGSWTTESIHRFKELVLGKIFVAKIYSVVGISAERYTSLRRFSSIMISRCLRSR